MVDTGAITLDDKYRLDPGRALVGGRQALVRLPLCQREIDRRRGLNTAGLISGYLVHLSVATTWSFGELRRY